MLSLSLWLLFSSSLARAADPPIDWIDPDTHHRILRLSTDPGSQSLYFHQNPFTPDGKKLLIITPHGLATVDLTTHELSPLPTGENVKPIITGRKTGNIYYIQNNKVFSVNPTTNQTREIAPLPENATANTVNSDETFIAGTITHDPDAKAHAEAAAPLSKAKKISYRYNLHLPMELFTMEVATGKIHAFHPSTAWLNHLQFSPADPTLLMFCHEGPWEKVDRTWLIRTDGTGLTQVHHRTMQNEIAGHEFFDPTGHTVYYDLQTPRSQVFWLAAYDLTTRHRTWYNLTRDEWSVHYNVSPDGTLFAGDGGGPGNVAHAPDGKWLYLFHPTPTPHAPATTHPADDSLITPLVFKSEKLVNMKDHDYALEPNVTFTPDQKWLIFRSNMHGPPHVYAVELARTEQ